MIKLNKKIAFGLTAFFFAMSAMAQNNTISGIVTDESGDVLAGVYVNVKGTGRNTITDTNGRYSISAQPGETISFSLVGMTPQDIRIQKSAIVNILMESDMQALDKVVVVGYGNQERASITGAIATVSDKEIMKAPTMSLSNMIGSRIAGVSAVQSSGQPGADEASLRMRGQGGIVYVIDGVRRTYADFNGLDPNEIESISVLKDASAVAVYGLDANGVFIVTTKQGKVDRTTISYTGTVGISQNAENQVWLDGPGYAYWYNKGRELQGDEIVFTKEMVDKMKAGVDGWGNTNWYKKLYGTGVSTHHNISASGGNAKVRFFASLGYLNEKGNLQGYNYTRYNLRSNVDAKIIDNLTFNLGVSGRIEQRRAPRYSADPYNWHNVPQQIIRALPYVSDTYELDGKIYPVATPTDSSPVSPYASITESGYNRGNSSYIQTNFSLKYDIPGVEGLNIKFNGALDLLYNFNKSLSLPFQVMLMQLPNKSTENLAYTLDGDPEKNVTLTESAAKSSSITTQTSINYANTFGRHTVGALLLAETRENRSNSLGASGTGLDFIELDELGMITNNTAAGATKYPSISGYSGNSKFAGFVGRVNYNYAERYYVEVSARYDGSYLFGGMNKRWVILPGVSAGWRINNEKWFSADWVNNLKLRGGIGKTATSGVAPFQWRNSMGFMKGQVVIGNNPQSMLYFKTIGNPGLSWEQCISYNVGIDANLWNNKLGIELDVFYKYEYDKIADIPGSYPPSMGGYHLSSANVNECDYKGFDLVLSHANNFGQFNYGARLVWSYAYGRWLKFAGDSNSAPDYQRLTGKQIGSMYGFQADGLFQNEQEILTSPTIAGSKVVPGYIKYIDQNGDGAITPSQDQGYFGKSSIPTHTGSLNLYANWKGFDLDMLFAWGLGNQVALTGFYTSEGSAGVQDNSAYTKPFYHGGNSPVYLVENSWTPEHTNAEFPRLEITPASNNNAYASTFSYRSGNYIRFKSAQLGYSLPQKVVSKVRIQKVRFFVEGYNLLTLSELTRYNIDPESPAVNNGYYPQQRTFTFGLNITF